MSVLNESLFTKTFNTPDPFTMLAEYGIRQYSIKVITGSATLLGGKTIGGIESDAVTLSEGDVFTGDAPNSACCFTLTLAMGAVVQVVAI